MSEPGYESPAVPPAGGRRPPWPTTPPPHRPLGSGDPAEAGPYRLEAVLGAGGMGRVYLGRTPAGSAVAVKVVHREYAGDRAFRRRFEQEVAAARRVQGLYTVPVVDADLTADEPWLATAYVPGPSLQDAVADEGPLPVEAAVGLIARVAEALQSIHAADVIHRDLKPSNIILTAEGPKVIDFGIARAADVTSVTGTGMLTGTPAYMAPEYLRGQTVTEAVDVFALGVVACFAATGVPAFGGGSHHGVTYRILEQAPDLDGCPEPVRTIAAACLEKDPQRRPTPAEVVRLCRPASATAGTAGPGHTVPSAPSHRAAPGSASDFHDAATAPAAPAARRERGGSDGAGGPAVPPGPDTRPSPPDPHPPATPAPSLPVLLGGLGILALVIVLIAVFLPGRSGKSDMPSEISPAATLVDLHTGNDVAMALSSDGTTLAVGGSGKVQLWDVASRKRKRNATFTQRDGSGKTVNGIPSLAFSRDGKRLAIGTDSGVVGLWDVAGHRQIGLTRGDRSDSVDGVAFSPDGKLLAAGNENGLRLWDADGGGARIRQVAVLEDYESWVKYVAFSPDGRTLAAGGYYHSVPDDEYSVPDDYDAVKLWDVSGRKVRRTLSHNKDIWGLAFSPDGKTVATSDEESEVRLWNVASGRYEDDVSEADAAFRSMAFSPDGKTLAVVWGDEVELFGIAGDERLTTLVGPPETVDNVKSVVFRPDGRSLVGITYGGAVRVWKLP